MKVHKLATAVAAILSMSIAFADSHAATLDPSRLPKIDCADFKFSEAFLSKYPDAPGACIEGRVKDGVRYARFNTKVYLSGPDFMTVKLLDVAGNVVTTFSFKPSPEARVLINDQPVPYKKIKKGARLTLWVPENMMEVRTLPSSSEDSWVVLPPIGN